MSGSYTIDVVALLVAAGGGLVGVVWLLVRLLVGRTLAAVEARATDHETRIRDLEHAASQARPRSECGGEHERIVDETRRETDRARDDVHAALGAVRDVARLVEREL